MVRQEFRSERRQAAVPDPYVGRVLNGRFRILERIGSGGMGKVYKAIQAPLGRTVAVKILSPGYAAEEDPQFRERFTLEASLTSKLRHPNTVMVIDYGQTEDGTCFLAMEYLEGQTLADELAAAGTLSWPRSLNIAQQICRSLREAHRMGVIHRDLKPANVMLLESDDGEEELVKVLDFGLVKPFTRSDPGLTRVGMFVGSPLYVAPEQVRNQADPRSDVYSLGILLYQMLVGRPPFTGRDSIDIILQHLNHPPPPFQFVRPDLLIPHEVELLTRTCLAKDPAKRFQSMEEVLRSVRQILGVEPSGVFSGPRNVGASAVVAKPPPAPSPAASQTEPLFRAVAEPRRGVFGRVVLFLAAIAASFGAVLYLNGSPLLTSVLASKAEPAPTVRATTPPASPASPPPAVSTPAPPAPVHPRQGKSRKR